jgi:hypothetical protein
LLWLGVEVLVVRHEVRHLPCVLTLDGLLGLLAVGSDVLLLHHHVLVVSVLYLSIVDALRSKLRGLHVLLAELEVVLLRGVEVVLKLDWVRVLGVELLLHLLHLLHASIAV